MQKRKSVDALGRRIGSRHKVCDECRTTMNTIKRKYRRKRLLNGGRDYDAVNPRNGKRSKKWVGGHLLIDATGTRRRLQALSALGYSYAKLGRMLGGISAQAVAQQATIRKTVTKETAARTKAIYDKLSMVKPERNPTERGNHVKRTQTLASRQGFVPPLAWDDDEIDDPMAFPTGAKLHVFRKWLNHQATPEQKARWEEMQVAEKQSA